jgi:hypothetical protein
VATKTMKKHKEITDYSTGQMVTIDELLKDDPKAFEEVVELRKWMDVNPHVFTFPKEKTTQGQKKIKQLLEDIRRNKKFAQKISPLTKAKPKYKPEDLHLLYGMYQNYFTMLQVFRKKFLLFDTNYKLRRAICREYGIDAQLLDWLVHASKEGRLEGWDFSEATSDDVCFLEIAESETLIDIHTFHLTKVDQTDRAVYPVRINLHRFASKRDVLDFVEKRWDYISTHLKEKRIKKRKLPRGVNDFIWKNREKKAKEIASLINDIYPQFSFTYSEVSKILTDERKRRKA